MTDFSYANRVDDRVRPQDDFFGYVNNKWLAAHPIPDSEVHWGAFIVLRDTARQHVRDLCEELQAGTFQPGTLEQQIRDYYASGLRFDQQQSQNRTLLADYFQKIDMADNLSALFGQLHRTGLGSPWRVIVDADDMDSSRHILRLMQARLTLPDRDYYLEQNDKMRHIRDAYQAHTRAMHRHFPALATDADQLWQIVWAFELALAKGARSRVELRDVRNNYNNTPFAELLEKYPHVDWPAYATALGWRNTSNLSVDQPEVIAAVDRLLAEQSLDNWKTYLKWLVLVDYGSKISEELSSLRFDFFGKVLSGAVAQQELWKRVVSNLDGELGEGVGRLYAARHFPESSKQQVLALVEDVRRAYAQRISGLDWMGAETKKVAQEKLANMKVLIGYPDKWRDFSKLEIGNNYLANTIAAEEFETDYWLGRLGKPTSRDDWFMHPQTVNAYNDPNRLVICFPGAILQPPFFDASAPLAANMGAIGTVIGHELTHGFDDEGCQFDQFGNVRPWQTEPERAEFARRAQLIVDQATQFEVLPDVHLKGKLILGESIADLGGLELAYQALLARVPDPSAVEVDRMTAEKLFFISFASTECGQTRTERKRQLALSDPHPPEQFRVNGMVSHCDAFYAAYGVQPGDALYRAPEDRARIW